MNLIRFAVPEVFAEVTLAANVTVIMDGTDTIANATIDVVSADVTIVPAEEVAEPVSAPVEEPVEVAPVVEEVRIFKSYFRRFLSHKLHQLQYPQKSSQNLLLKLLQQ